MKGVYFMTLTLRCLATALAQGSCPVVSYSGSFDPRDHVKDHALVGFSYKNITSQTVDECFHACLNDCRCASYQMKGIRCELIDEDRHTAPTGSYIGGVEGYKYFELKQRFSAPKYGRKASCPSNGCLNGCCLSNPCLNGGTCIELCHSVKRKFQCKCIQHTCGRVCEKCISSCADITTNPPTSPPTNPPTSPPTSQSTSPPTSPKATPRTSPRTPKTSPRTSPRTPRTSPKTTPRTSPRTPRTSPRTPRTRKNNG